MPLSLLNLGAEQKMLMPRNLKLLTLSPAEAPMKTGTSSPNLSFLKSTISSLVLLKLIERLVLQHHSTRCSITLLYTCSSTSVIQSTRVVIGEFVDGFGTMLSHTIMGIKRVGAGSYAHNLEVHQC